MFTSRNFTVIYLSLAKASPALLSLPKAVALLLFQVGVGLNIYFFAHRVFLLKMPRRRLDYTDLFPKEILTDNIFTRLPLKSLGRCKCVSKPWKSLISDPYFVKTHLTKTSTDDTKIILISNEPNPGRLYSVDVDNNNLRYGHRSHLNFDCSDSWYRIWGSCDGLVLAQRDQTWTSMYLLNPTTLESKQIPVLPSLLSKYRNIAYMFGFGYDSLSDDYAVVSISYWPEGEGSIREGYMLKKNEAVARVYVYMLKKNYWDKVGLAPYNYKQSDGGAGMFVGGCLHWLVKNVGSPWFISAFTIASKEFSQVAVPDRASRLGVLKGCLCLINMDASMGISELWVMKEYGVLESWIKFSVNISKVNPQVPLHLQENNLVEMDNGKSFLVVTNAEEAKPHNCTKVGISQSITEAGMTYVESLVSPNNKEAHQKEKIRRRSNTIK